MQDMVTRLLFANDKDLLVENENEWQRSLCILNMIIQDYNIKVSTKIFICMTLHRGQPERSKILMNDQPVKHLQPFTYLSCNQQYGQKKVLTGILRNIVICVRQLLLP
jgi:hypothetical protein